jgi:hypothetical protein
MTLPPWVFGAFELLLHAELHFRAGNDFDRRIALISFDNSIEVSVSTYLSLHPMQRKNRVYAKADVEKWLINFNAMLEFLEKECLQRSVIMEADMAHMLWYHKIRNEQYHEGKAAIPNADSLAGIRHAALWAFSMLYEISDVEKILEARILDLMVMPDKPPRDEKWDRLIDKKHGVINVAGFDYYVSELLYSMDFAAYSDLAIELKSLSESGDEST